MYTYTVDTEKLTIFAINSDGEENDLNADGEACESLEDLVDFIAELSEQGYYSDMTASLLMSPVLDAMADTGAAPF